MDKRRLTTIKIIRTGRSQTIRIPVELGFDTDTVTLEKRGEALIVRPAQPSGWDRFFADDSLVLPEDVELGEDRAPHDRHLF